MFGIAPGSFLKEITDGCEGGIAFKISFVPIDEIFVFPDWILIGHLRVI
jgi:hypothetical protein